MLVANMNSSDFGSQHGNGVAFSVVCVCFEFVARALRTGVGRSSLGWETARAG